MFGVYFGKYLEDKGILTTEQYHSILEECKTAKVKLGLLAVEEGVMTFEQAEEVNTLQQMEDRRFGDIAVEKGYLTDDQVSTLLERQADSYLLFVQAIVERNILDLDQIQKEMNSYKKQEKMTALDIEALKSGDIDRIVPIFTKGDDIPQMIKEYVALTARNFVRFIDTHFRIEPVRKIDSYTASYVAAQELAGDKTMLTGYCGDGKGIKVIAENFAKEIFEHVNIDVLDAACEFLNCNNGLFVTKLSYEDMDLDMRPPIMKDVSTTIHSGVEMYKVPIHIGDAGLDLIICAGEGWALD